ncbi:MAG: hypothetical protein M1376_05820 [Planctomycetes bacterium]|nr:hypothetical protein [Planctomycetota bacterium]
MIGLVMLALMAGCAAGLFFKGTLAMGVAMIFNALIAGFAAFGFFEIAAKFLVQYSPGLAPWAPMVCFLLLLVLVFALLMAVEMLMSKEKVELGLIPERIGRPAAGVVLGYLVTGYLLVAGAMAPLPSQYPYPRFDARSPNAASPKKALLSPDGFVTGLFATISKGGFGPIGEPKSFALLHAGFLDQLYLNRHKGKEVPLMTSTLAIDSPRKAGVWNVPDSQVDTEGKPLSAPAGTRLMLVRADIKKSALRDASKFTLAQWRLVCGVRSTGAALVGKGQAAYPIGYIGPGGRFERKSLADVITAEAGNSQGDAITIDLGFPVPANLTPLLLEFKRNNIVPVSAVASAEEAPQPVAFGAPAPAPRPQTAPDAGPAAQPGQPATSVEPAPGQSAPPASAPAAGSKGKNRKSTKRPRDITGSVTSPQVQEN